MVKNNFNLFQILIKDNNVNNYTKVLILISQLNHFGRFDVPNKLIMNRLGISKAYSIRIINLLKYKGLIKVYYIGQKRKIKLNNTVDSDPFNYDWFNDYE